MKCYHNSSIKKGKIMNNILKQILIGLTVLALTACGSSGSKKKVQDNGLTKEINDLVPEDILEEMISLGMPIHRGGKPPKMEGIYYMAPVILLASNIPSDPIGNRFDDYLIKFYGQDNQKLTIQTKYKSVSASNTGHGGGSFIVGTDNKFTIFSKVDDITRGHQSVVVDVWSGTITNNGIEDLYLAVFVIDNKGGGGVVIGNGQGRVVYDSDGVSEKKDNIDFKILKSQDNKLLKPKYPSMLVSHIINNND